jgi:hypothetical protein
MHPYSFHAFYTEYNVLFSYYLHTQNPILKIVHGAAGGSNCDLLGPEGHRVAPVRAAPAQGDPP